MTRAGGSGVKFSGTLQSPVATVSNLSRLGTPSPFREGWGETSQLEKPAITCEPSSLKTYLSTLKVKNFFYFFFNFACFICAQFAYS